MRRFLLFLISLTILVGCSPINSVAPFDDHQAAIIAREWYNAKQQSYRRALLLADRH